MKIHKAKGVLFLLLALVLTATALAPAPALATAGPSGVLYVATAGPPLGNQSVVVIDLASGTVADEIPVAPNIPHGLAMTPGGQRLYASYMGGPTIQVIDTAAGQVVDTIPVGVPSHHIQVNRQGTELYIAPGMGSNFYIYDLREGSLLPPLAVGPGATDVAVSPSGRTALVASTGAGGSVSVVDLLRKEVLAIVPLPPAPVPPPVLMPAADHAIFSPNGKLGYIVDRGANRLAVLDLSTNSWVTTVPVGAAPHGVAVTNDGQFIYVGNRGLGTPLVPFGNTLSVIDAETYTVVDTITVGARPDHLTLDRSGRFIFIPITRPAGSQKILVLDVSTNTVIDEIPVGRDLHVSVQGHN